ncbi:hypothetical protein B0H17DRAFT_1139571 [Mycena rosella]|uniref:Uncharacterized protein n=1 Tax=Mycena rosella TaxID=1033263 RepID=A0AAD7D443_MYCRO|nr:hypothetical protein B0H17DRAFT_1139571 [Mycena rosella]
MAEAFHSSAITSIFPYMVVRHPPNAYFSAYLGRKSPMLRLRVPKVFSTEGGVTCYVNTRSQYYDERAAIKALGDDFLILDPNPHPHPVTVYSLFLLEVAQTGITSHFAYSILVTGWESLNILVKLPSLNLATSIFIDITSASVQIFFAWLIYFLKGEKMVYRGISILAWIQSLAAIISDAKFAVTTEVAELQNLMSGVKIFTFTFSEIERKNKHEHKHGYFEQE